jgi:acyl-CoA dehydrogenase
MRELFESTIERLLADTVTPELLRHSETGAWPEALWAALADSGFAVAAAPEALGGAGASWADLFVVVRAAGKHNAPVPLVETLLANWLLGRCGIEAINAPLGLAASPVLTLRDGHVSGTLVDVPWGRDVKQVVAITAGAAPQVLLLEAGHAQIECSMNTAGEPRDTLRFEAATPKASAALPAGTAPDALLYGAAMMRSAQIAGALHAVLDGTTRYATERVQFGKPIGSFQAIQHQIALLAEHTIAANMAAEAAFAESSDDTLATLQIAVAKVSSAEAASVAAGIAHAVHGAIGFTHEYALNHATRRLWSWRSEYGSSTTWSQRIGLAVCANGAVALWPALTAGSMKLPTPAVAHPPAEGAIR